MDWKQKEAERESEKIKNNNLEKQVKILELQTENFALKKQIDSIGGATSPTASPDGTNEYKEMLSWVSHLENTKLEYEEELKNRYLEIQRLNKLKEMQIHSEKEKAYLAEIDALKLEVSELRAENYDLLSSNDRLKNDKINMEQ